MRTPRLTGTPDAERIDRLPIVVWNVHLGGGDVDSLLNDLRSGRLTGTPERQFVLLLQEALREGGAIPEEIPATAESADRIQISSTNGAPSSIELLASRNGLYVFYVPSMRNGRPVDGVAREDRGNAIISTLPLRDPEAIELPLQSQRRVAAAARVSGRSGATGIRWSLRLVSVHLDHRSDWRRLYLSMGAGRAQQAERLVELLKGEGAIAVGGDLNTWLGGDREAAVQILRARFPLPREVDDRPTLQVPLLPDRTVDHLFFGIPEGWSAHYEVLQDSYGSDHRPLLGWVDFNPDIGVHGPVAGTYSAGINVRNSASARPVYSIGDR